VSGQISRDDQGVRCGVVGEDATVADAVAAARISTLNLLSRINESVGLSAVVGVPKLTVWVASSKEFTDQPAIAETCSKLLLSVL
ncbi:RidA family protein, partial [Mycobacterium kansasii]